MIRPVTLINVVIPRQHLSGLGGKGASCSSNSVSDFFSQSAALSEYWPLGSLELDILGKPVDALLEFSQVVRIEAEAVREVGGDVRMFFKTYMNFLSAEA